jgi:hypothetical protein
MIIPKSATDSGFHQSARKSKWIRNIFLHARSSISEGARSMANYIARNHQEEFVAAAKEEAGLAPMGCDACHWHQLQDGIPTPRIEGTGRQ